MGEIKPCPFCGSPPSTELVADRITCATDGCCMSRMAVRLTEWNRRALLPAATPPAPPCGHGELLEVAKHTFGSPPDPGDEACVYCGLNFRDRIHCRVGEQQGPLGKWLRNYNEVRAAMTAAAEEGIRG